MNGSTEVFYSTAYKTSNIIATMIYKQKKNKD